MLEQRLIILFSLAVAVKFGGWTGASPLLCSGGLCSFGHVGRVLLYRAFAFSLSCRIASVASHVGGGGFRGLWGGDVHLCLGSWLWGWISWGPFGALELVMAVSFPFSFFLCLGFFGLGLACLVIGSSLKESIFVTTVLHIFNKLMKNKQKDLLAVGLGLKKTNYNPFDYLTRRG